MLIRIHCGKQKLTLIWLNQIGEERDFLDISAKEMATLLTKFGLCVLKPDSITAIFNSIER